MENKKGGAGKLAPYCYIAPITLILVTFVIGSVAVSVALGFTKYNIMTEPVFRGIDNYSKLMSDSKFVKALKKEGVDTLFAYAADCTASDGSQYHTLCISRG